jgi:ribonuclease P protein component
MQTEYFSVHVLSNELPYARLGVVTAKRVAPRAVDRNFAKRVVRERFRRQQGRLAGLDVLVRVRRRVPKEQGRVAGDELTNLFCLLIS